MDYLRNLKKNQSTEKRPLLIRERFNMYKKILDKY